MSTLRRLPSLECAANNSHPPLSSRTRNLSRLLSLPQPSLRQQCPGLPFLPSRESHCRSSGRGPPFLPPSCSNKQDRSHRRLTSSLSMPAWARDHQGARTARSITYSVSREDALDIHGSVVYKDLCESIHLEVPESGCLPGSEGALQRSVQGASRPWQAENSLEVSASDVPISLRMLKHRSSSKSPVNFPHPLSQSIRGEHCPPPACSGEVLADDLLSHVPGAVNSACGMLIFMMESLQQHALRLRNAFMCEADAQFQMMMERVRKEMQDTFCWLFEMVFACTPKLMLLTMILLTDFAVHSMGGHIALAVPPQGEPPTYAIESLVPASILSVDLRLAAFDKSSNDCSSCHTSRCNDFHGEPCFSEGGSGGGVVKVVKIGGGMDGGTTSSNVLTDKAAITAQEETHATITEALSLGSDVVLHGENPGLKENQRLAAMWQQALDKESISDSVIKSGHILVAPVRAPTLEADDYTCYDRTDLNYQHELTRDPGNPLLLANYAQFQHVVRHDHDRADDLYKRAVKADPVDGELMGKYASFLWVAKEDLEAADEAFKAALAVDPSNAHQAGSYAHFLWNSDIDDDDVPTTSTNYCEVPTS